MTTYKIVRVYFNDHPKETIVRGLTLEQAQRHCNDPETSSKTCTTPEGKRRTLQYGQWFDAYYEER